MNDISKFFRFSVPGSVFFFGIMTLILLLLPSETLIFLRDISTIFGAALSAFLIPTLGFICSTIHHLTHSFDHRDAISEVKNLFPTSFPPNQTVTWSELNAFWYAQSESSEVIKSTTSQTRDLADKYHSIGSCLWAANLALILSLPTLIAYMGLTRTAPISPLFWFTALALLAYLFRLSRDRINQRRQAFFLFSIRLLHKEKGGKSSSVLHT